MAREPLGFFPRLRTPQSPATHAREGTDHRARAWDYVIGIADLLTIHLQHATSCRTAAIVPFIGDYMNFAYTPIGTWTWTSGRGWYEVAPGAAAVLGGLLLLFSANRAVAILGAWLGIAAGAWLIIGPQLATFLDIGSIGTPTGTSNGVIALERLFYFDAIGAAILLVAAVALGRLSVRSVGDVRAAHRREAAVVESPASGRAAIQPATTAAKAAAPAAPAATEGPVATAARGDVPANRQHHRHFHFMRRHRGEQTQPTTSASGTQTQDH